MNFLCHAIPYLDQPLIAVSSGVPDWLSVVDRKIRARGRLAMPHTTSDDPVLAQVARGIVMHHEDDHWFHGGEAFVRSNLELAVQLRDRLPGDDGFRPTFVAHILIEMLLDASWIRDRPVLADQYYNAIEHASADQIQRCVNIITGKPTTELVAVIERFAKSRFLYDYLDHDKLLMRLNQVMKRVGLATLPDSLIDWFPSVMDLVNDRRESLLTPESSVSAYPLPGR